MKPPQPVSGTHIYCAGSGEHIFTTSDRGLIRVTTAGECVGCGQFFAYKELHVPGGHTQKRWPMKLVGYSCKECYAKD